MNKLIKKQEDIIQQDLDNGKFGMICSNEDTFKRYVFEKLDIYRKETAEYVIQEMILPNVNTDDKEWEAVDRYRREQIKMKEELLLIIKIKL